MIELEVYAAGVRDLSKILELDHELEAVPGLHYKVDSNHDLVYMELEEPVITFREIRAIFRRLGFEPRFIGAVPPELRWNRAERERAARGVERRAAVPCRRGSA
ncbi:MAG: hypothetical protein ABJB22_06325 [Verrucomicrobiota bacterium]